MKLPLTDEFLWNLEGKEGIILTREGINKVIKAKFKLFQKRKRKDGKWIMVIFDIPEKKRFSRDFLRKTLYLLGYKMLQQSVWVSPYDVYKETQNFIQRGSLDSYVKMFLIKEI